MRDNGCLNKINKDTWIDYKKETILFSNALWDGVDKDKSSVASPTMDKKGKDQLFFHYLPMACLT